MLAFTIIMFAVILWAPLFVVNYWLIYRAIFNIERTVAKTDRNMCKLVSALHVLGLIIALVASVIAIFFVIEKSEKFDDFLKKLEK